MTLLQLLKAKLPSDQAKKVNDLVLGIISEEIVAGRKIELTGIGSFSLTQRKDKRGYDMINKKEVIVPAHKTVGWHTFSAFRKRVWGL